MEENQNKPATEKKQAESGATPKVTPQEKSAEPETTPEASPPANRKYIYNGTPKKAHQFSLFGIRKIQPHLMTDEQVEKYIKKHPDLARLWDVKE